MQHEYGSYPSRANSMSSYLLANREYQQWFPNGKTVGNEYVTINTTRADKTIGSFSINTVTGVWADFAAHHSGADLVDLYAYYRGLALADALIELETRYGAREQCQTPIIATAQNLQPSKPISIPPKPCADFRLYDGHGGYLEPSNIHSYRNLEGKLIGYKAVYKPGRDGKTKEAIPWTFCKKKNDLLPGWHATEAEERDQTNLWS